MLCAGFELNTSVLFNAHSLNKIVNIYDRHGEHRSDVLMVLPGWATMYTTVCIYAFLAPPCRVKLCRKKCITSMCLCFQKILPSFFVCYWNSVCTSMDWDKDGDILAVTQDKNGRYTIIHCNWILWFVSCFNSPGVLFMWNVHNFEVSKLDTGMK